VSGETELPVRRPNSTSRIAHLDGLRGLAVVLVFLHHFAVPVLIGPPGSVGAYAVVTLTLTFAGVDLFFVLSGYLIGGILIDNRNSPCLFKTFYLRRSARILPLAFLFIGFVFIAIRMNWFNPSIEGSVFPWWVYASFTSNFWSAYVQDWGFRPLSLLWSLAIEEQFYAVAPLVVWWIRPAALPHALLVTIVLAPILRMACCFFGDAGRFAAHFLPFCRMDSLAMGMLVSWALRDEATLAALQRHSRWIVRVTVLAFLSLALLTKWRVAPGHLALATWGYSAISLACAGSLLLLELNPRSNASAVLGRPAIAWVGRLSYFIYLFQTVLVGLAISVIFSHRLAITPAQSIWQLGVGLLVFIAAAVASWNLFETPLINLARRFRY
jgi:peptidoglycan/LPS O-acetylase OafA/YrhL